jgi:hypothetical protein
LPELEGCVALVLLLAAAVPVRAMPGDRLTCRVMGGPWQPCTMLVDADGLSWQLKIGTLSQIQFRHDGMGHVSMRSGDSKWQTVEARWLADASLCWDGVCAKGAIPLD